MDRVCSDDMKPWSRRGRKEANSNTDVTIYARTCGKWLGLRRPNEKCKNKISNIDVTDGSHSRRGVFRERSSADHD